jgi:hypothetical protein
MEIATTRLCRSSKLALSGLTLATLAAAQIPTCGGSGLSIVGGRLGDPWSLAISGPPNAGGILASDVAGGPVLTPFGVVCLGLTPGLVTMPVSLDPLGAFGQSGVLPLAAPFAAGSSLFAQVALAHPSLPGGYALTNGSGITFRPPRIGVFRWGGNPATTFDLIDAVTDTVAFSSPISPTYQGGDDPVIRIPRLGWYGWRRTGDGAFVCVDDFTGANVLTIPGVAPPGNVITQSVVASDDGAFLFAMAVGPGSSASVNTISVKTWSLPSGTLLSTWALQLPFFSFRGLYPIPGTSLVYLCDGNQIFVIDGVPGALVTTISLPGLLHGQDGKYAFLSQGHLYAITTGAPPGQTGGLLVVINTSAHALVGAPTFVPGGAIQPLAIASGSAGAPAFWLSAQYGGVPMLTEVSLSALTATPVVALPGGGAAPVADCQGTAGGTELLILEGNQQASAVNVATGQLTPVLNGISAIEVLRSGTLTKAYALVSVTGTPAVLAFPTDPVGSGTGVALPPPTATIWFASVVTN